MKRDTMRARSRAPLLIFAIYTGVGLVSAARYTTERYATAALEKGLSLPGATMRAVADR